MKTPVCPPVALQQAVMQSLRHYLLRANQALSTRFSEPAISWQQRGTIAGTAWPENWEIRINPILLLENQQPFIDEVIPHELAHLLVWKKFGRVAPHGKEWRWMMVEVLNVTPHRTHPFSASTVAGKTWPYLCACQQHMLTLRRHNRVQRQQAKYRCKICGCFLKPSDFPAHSA